MPEKEALYSSITHHEDTSVFSFIDRADYTIHQELEEWSQVAASNVSRAIKEDLPLRGRIEANAGLILLIQSEAVVQAESFRGVRDRSGNLQCAAIVTNLGEHLRLEFIATAPWNITKDSSKSVSEAGTSLMVELVRESKRLGYSGRILLEAVSGSPAFYQGIGFIRTEFGSASAPEMELSPSAADEFLKRYS